MKNILKYLPVLLGLLPVSCGKMMFDDCSKSVDMDVDRMVLVYMAADNNLAMFAKKNIEEMKKGDVPYYFDDGSGDVLLVYADIAGEEPRLMRLSKDRFGTVTEETLRVYEDQNSCSDSVMTDVLSYASALFPSMESGLVLWSHGTGWLPEGYYSNPVYASSDGGAAYQHHIVDPYADLVKSFGEDGGSEMDIRALAKALPVHYSFILMDACLMGGIEVAYELRDCCDYFIGSAAEVLANGFPYEQVVGEFFDGERGLRNACRLFYEHYEDEGATVYVAQEEPEDSQRSQTSRTEFVPADSGENGEASPTAERKPLPVVKIGIAAAVLVLCAGAAGWALLHSEKDSKEVLIAGQTYVISQTDALVVEDPETENALADGTSAITNTTISNDLVIFTLPFSTWTWGHISPTSASP